MLPSVYAFINADNLVVNVISGALDTQQQAQFLRDYGILFGATQIIEVGPDTAVWIDGTYSGGEFLPPPVPEPLPEPLPAPELQEPV
jgi:hypothetical protein